uniref:Uncharacterized protein n=1 Tax=Arundo donax TaxID=35708 RepID=A0A0A9FTB2_ARUDO
MCCAFSLMDCLVVCVVLFR